MKKVLSAVLFLFACSDDPGPYTWGEAATAVSTDYCNAIVRCGQYPASSIKACIDHNVFHFCGLDDTCDIPLPAAEPLADQCAADLAVDTVCEALAWGYPPTSCIEVINMDPGP